MSAIRVAHISTVAMGMRYLLLNQLQTLGASGYEVTGISAPGPDIEPVQQAGIRHIPAPLSRGSSPLADLAALWQLYRILRREKFDIVHTHTPKAGLLGQWAALLARVPHRVHTIHGLYFPGHMRPERRWMYVLLERITMLPSHLNLSQNPEDIPVAIEEHISPADRLQLIGNGIDLRQFDPAPYTPARRAAIKESLDIAPDAPVIGMVARFVGEKGYGEMLQAARTIHGAEPEVRFIFAGPIEPWKPDAMDPALIAEMGLEDAVRFLGHRDDVVDLYAVMDILALPSHREGYPRAPMEAAAMGVPAVATNIRGCRQTVEDGVTGYLVPLRDPDALAAALLDLLRDGEKRRRFGEAARRKALAEFDEQDVFARVAAAYADLLATHS